MIGVPDALARGTVEREGQPGAAWPAALPEIIASLLDRWACVPDGDTAAMLAGQLTRRRTGARAG